MEEWQVLRGEWCLDPHNNLWFRWCQDNKNSECWYRLYKEVDQTPNADKWQLWQNDASNQRWERVNTDTNSVWSADWKTGCHKCRRCSEYPRCSQWPCESCHVCEQWPDCITGGAIAAPVPPLTASAVVEDVAVMKDIAVMSATPVTAPRTATTTTTTATAAIPTPTATPTPAAPALPQFVSHGLQPSFVAGSVRPLPLAFVQQQQQKEHKSKTVQVTPAVAAPSVPSKQNKKSQEKPKSVEAARDISDDIQARQDKKKKKKHKPRKVIIKVSNWAKLIKTLGNVND